MPMSVSLLFRDVIEKGISEEDAQNEVARMFSKEKAVEQKKERA